MQVVSGWSRSSSRVESGSDSSSKSKINIKVGSYAGLATLLKQFHVLVFAAVLSFGIVGEVRGETVEIYSLIEQACSGNQLCVEALQNSLLNSGTLETLVSSKNIQESLLVLANLLGFNFSGILTTGVSSAGTPAVPPAKTTREPITFNDNLAAGQKAAY